MLALLACTNCLENPAAPVDATVERDRASEQQTAAKYRTPNHRHPSGISSPETIAPVPETSQKTQAKLPQAADALQEVALPSVRPKLAIGSTGAAVLQIQSKLQQLGYYSGSLDSRYGEQTRSAVLAFQKAQKLPEDGVVGAQTQLRLSSRTTPPSAKAANSPAFVQNQASASAPASKPIAKSKIATASLFGLLVFFAAGLGVVAVMRKYGSVAQLQTALAGDFPYPVERRGNGLFDEPEEIEEFEQPVMLQQSPALPNAIAWTLIGLALFGLTWASIAKIEQVVPARGQLKPQGAVKEIQAPTSGVVKQVFIKDGQHVKAGDLLVSFDPTAPKAELESLRKVRAALVAETEFYRRILASSSPIQVRPTELDLAPEVLSLAKNRAAILAENQLLRSRLNGGSGAGADSDEQSRLAVANAEFQARQQAAALAVAQLEQELNKNQAQLADTRTRLATDESVLQQIAARNRSAVANAQKSLEIDKTILGRIEPLVEEGAIARVQYDRQLQEVTQRSSTLLNESSQGQIQYNRQLQEVQSRKAEIAQLQAEQKRLRFDIAQSRAESVNTTSTLQKDVLDTISANKQKLADLDSQMNKTIVENKKRLAEIDSKISQNELSLKYQDLRAPVDGTVFDLQSRDAGFVADASKTLVKIVPDDSLVAEVFITNKDIGFVRENMKADIRIESFPYSEYGQISGKVISVGSDALPPDNANQTYRFPAKIQLDQQALNVDRRDITLQSGMAVDVNIKIREDRRVISLLTDLFTKNIESLENIK